MPESTREHLRESFRLELNIFTDVQVTEKHLAGDANRLIV